MKYRFTLCILVLISSAAARADEQPQVIPLWEGGAPGFEDRRSEPEVVKDSSITNVHNPSLTLYLPPADKANGTAVVICPGGGHRTLVVGPEGREPAQFLNKLGITAFVLKYRLAREPDSPYKLGVHPKDDGYRALRLVRSRAAEWKLDPKRIGIMGFSAGGEVVSWVAYGSGDGAAGAADPIDRVNGRPDFQILIYPGPLGVPEEVPNDAPPAFFLVANDDKGHVEPIIKLINEYRAAGAPFEAIIYAHGGHGFNMGNRSKLAAIQHWPERLADWLADSGYLQPAGPAAN
jgi:acetyl esterase/lipase